MKRLLSYSRLPAPGLLAVLTAAALGALRVPAGARAAPRHAVGPGTITGAAAAAQQRFGVPASMLEAICYLEGHLSDRGARPRPHAAAPGARHPWIPAAGSAPSGS